MKIRFIQKIPDVLVISSQVVDGLIRVKKTTRPLKVGAILAGVISTVRLDSEYADIHFEDGRIMTAVPISAFEEMGDKPAGKSFNTNCCKEKT